MLRHASPRTLNYTPFVYHLPRHWCVSREGNISHADSADGGTPSGQRYGARSARRRQQSAPPPPEFLVPAVARGGSRPQKLRNAVKVKECGMRPALGEKDVPETPAAVVQDPGAVRDGAVEAIGEQEPAAAGDRVGEEGMFLDSGSTVGAAVKGRTGENGGPGPRDINALSEAAPSYSPLRHAAPCRVLHLPPTFPATPGIVPGLASLKRRAFTMPPPPPPPRRLGRYPLRDRPGAQACVCAHLSKKTTPKGAAGKGKGAAKKGKGKIKGKSKKEKEKEAENKRQEEARQSRAAKKAFKLKRQTLAEEFLKKVDKKVGKGGVEKALEDNAPVRIVWTKILRTAAGTARWRVDRYEDTEGKIYMVQNFAKVELSDRIIDNKLKMYNVLCHEYCHLANYLIDGVKERGHGKLFKKWAERCTKAFSHLGVKVTVQHSYPIPWRYWWSCQNPGCRSIYARQTQSIDPDKTSCLSCKTGKLVQTRPRPRKKQPLTEYQMFVRDNFKRIKTEYPYPNLSSRTVMSLVALEYKNFKTGGKGEEEEEKEKEEEEKDEEKDEESKEPVDNGEKEDGRDGVSKELVEAGEEGEEKDEESTEPIESREKEEKDQEPKEPIDAGEKEEEEAEEGKTSEASTG